MLIMIGRCLGVHTDIGRDMRARLSSHIYICVHEERVDVAYLASYYAL